MNKIKGWAYCAPSALEGRDFVIQASADVAVGWTGSTGRMIVARCNEGEVGQVWTDGEFAGTGTGTAFAWLGEDGSERFASEIQARKAGDLGDELPQVGHHQFAEQSACERFAGIVSELAESAKRGNLRLAGAMLESLKLLAQLGGMRVVRGDDLD